MENTGIRMPDGPTLRTISNLYVCTMATLSVKILNRKSKNCDETSLN